VGLVLGEQGLQQFIGVGGVFGVHHVQVIQVERLDVGILVGFCFR